MHNTRHITIYEVPNPRGIVTGEGPARMIRLGQTQMVIQVGSAGRYRVAVRYSPYWSTVNHAGCVSKGDDGMLRLDAQRRGRIVLQFKAKPTRVLAAMVGANTSSDCGLPSSP